VPNSREEIKALNQFGSDAIRNEILLIARILLVALYLIFGWDKLTDYSGTVAYMSQTGVPLPSLATVIAIVMELFVAIAIVVGILTRPLAVLLALYTLATGLLGHHYWTLTGPAQYESMINFYKNVSIMGGCLLLYVTGPDRYSLDGRFGSR
jgi:putative oxidoreductase